MLLLAALANEPGHGYALVDRLRQRSAGIFNLSEGTVYPALYRLERAKLVSSRWSAASGRRRRIYALTEKGRRALASQRTDWATFAAAVEGVVGT